jgi:hypothetical protein
VFGGTLEVSGWEFKAALRGTFLIAKDKEWFLKDLETWRLVFGARVRL